MSNPVSYSSIIVGAVRGFVIRHERGEEENEEEEAAVRRGMNCDRTPGPRGYLAMVDRLRASNSSGRALSASDASAKFAHCRFLLCFSGHSVSSLVTVTS